jgi:hypothetical protein
MILGDALDGRPLGQAGQQHGELVAALAGHGVGFAHAGDDAPGRLDQQAVAGLVAEGVVDFLEAVEVDEQHGHAVVVRWARLSVSVSRSLSRRRLGRPVSGS